MARTIKKLGDVFMVKLDGDRKKYFQYVANDSTQLGSDVIRAFKQVYTMGEEPTLSLVVNGEVDFYAHCIVKVGIKLSLWEKVGNVQDVGELGHVLFRNTNDYGHKVGQEPIRISNNWHIWRINDAKFTRVGKLEGDNRKAEIGLVFDPMSIVNKLRTGEYGHGAYPGY